MVKRSGSFEDNLLEVDEIIEKLENGELTLTESIKEYENAMKLLKKSSDLLNKAEGKILKVTEESDNILVEEV
ncbi:MAG: exodeoxyribonuclease VII small subunit [Fusobacterium varium]|jgi:exodeoxyribonuclease VII small subunit|uniref:Exodeoxyribonuclease 7 small subunit n=1 Tax=Fusobacterium varium ATCC 27725 TaxID=469618 RepID=A0ABM6U4D1_FUSVA|nr:MULTISPECIES: exodeoxyribonuclease VII small subunit [Fusobacterium]AVQ31167.1 exodeoxyribonuclease VII small subunit [Fusobacterium varium ATCC 27725]EES62481.1 exodeoxyribonuclease VII, small subunit [Fusobacterium varium ATCC 27725]MCI6031527.1 exodeoxyribonuclease VII small subunit [Fusobacterium varium]MDY4006855.1 exodeoxyribonuclease VII small subunit [Fusobacterium varium]VEH40142.1 Exodeoxyribonuclease 7 small subunit [Fusobacterium varium]